MKKLPLARSTGIVVQELGKEILIYDLNTHKAYNLNETSSTVYQACDGKTTFDELKQKHKFTDDLIFLALDQLKADGLIEDGYFFISPFIGMSRREAIRKVGFASMIALPLISSLVAPTAAMAQSAGSQSAGTPTPVPCVSYLGSCSSSSQCCSSAPNCNPTVGSGSFCCRGNSVASTGVLFRASSGQCSARGPEMCCSGTATRNNRINSNFDLCRCT
jgi:hypothetical protein